ncbi:MAG: tetratricopeptide repeat protein [Phycisphaerales bacterium]|nr:tetratricopeptide repeat protein [Phycisphaerales bacterium]
MAEPRLIIQQALAQAQSGRLGPAIAALERLTQKKGAPAEAHHFLGMLLFRGGQTERAIFCLDRASKLAPGRPQFESNYANVLHAAGRTEQALAHYFLAIHHDASYAPAHVGLSGTLLGLGRLHEAEQHARLAWEQAPDNAEAASNLASCLILTGRAAEAVGRLNDAIARIGPGVQLNTLLAAAMNYDASSTPEGILEAHRTLGRLHALAASSLEASGLPPLKTNADSDRLRIGYLSADFGDHPVGMFIEPALESDEGMAVFCYATGPVAPDRRGCGVTWRECGGIGDRDLVSIVRADRIDVLVELSGHSLGHRQTAVAARMAPVQASFLGYPATTGNPAIDARFVDGFSDPPGAETWCTERLVRIDPCAWCFSEPAGAPEPGLPPCVSGRPVTFGSFNNLAKTVPAVLDAWTGVLAATPGSRLLLKNGAFIDERTRARILEALVARGVDPSRVQLVPPTRDAVGHMTAYAHVDIALDTFPYAGTTTTCEALWMGIPVVTLAGACHAGRVGVSVLSAVGLEAWIARDPDEYVRLASTLAADRERLVSLRGSLRDRMRRSPLMDREAYRSRLHAAYIELAQQRRGGSA